MIIDQKGSPLLPSLVNDGDLLTKEYYFTQTFKVKKENSEKFDQALKTYISFMLDDFGLFFYRATYSTSSLLSGPAAAAPSSPSLPFDGPSSEEPALSAQEGGTLLFNLHLYLFTAKRFQEEVYPPLAPMKARQALDSPQFLDGLIDPSLYCGYWSELFYEQASMKRQAKFHGEQMPQGTFQGHFFELGWSFLRLFEAWWLIVPRAQSDFFNLLYQMYTFDVAHQCWFPKIVHMFTIPINICMTIAFFCQLPLFGGFFAPFSISLGFAFAVFLSLLYIGNGFAKMSRTWGFATATAIMLLWGVAALWNHIFTRPDAPWYNPTGNVMTNPITVLYISSFAEALSHGIVPQLPPYVVGVNHWVDTLTFFLQGEKIFLLFGFFAALIFSPLVSYISCVHLIGDMILYAMLLFGYHAEFFEEYSRMVKKAELTGNPALDDAPLRFQDLIHGMPGNSGVPSKSSLSQ